MTDDLSSESTWEISRVGEPLRFNDLIILCLRKVIDYPSGTKQRHRALRDVSDLLSPYHDQSYEESIVEALEKREEIISGKSRGIQPDESEEIYQSLWLNAISWLMKRYGMHGEEWTRK